MTPDLIRGKQLSDPPQDHRQDQRDQDKDIDVFVIGCHLNSLMIPITGLAS